MNINLLKSIFLLLFIHTFLFAQDQKTVTSYVDPTIGGVGLILVPTRPTVHFPNSMVRVFPARKDQLDDQIGFFPLTISSHRHEWLFGLMAFSGKADTSHWKKRFAYDKEKITPYHYSVELEETSDKIEFTPSAKSGYFRFHFGSEAHHLRLQILNKGQVNIDGKRNISGVEEFMGMKAYFYGELNTDIVDSRYSNNAEKKVMIAELDPKSRTVGFRYGVSFISIDQAKMNLQKEIPDWDFETVKGKAEQIWEKALSKIIVEGGTEAQKRVFYTALYRAYERMIDINEGGKYYSGFDHKIHESKEPFFVDNWLWDTYLALEPLQTILVEWSSRTISPGKQCSLKGVLFQSFVRFF